MMAAISISRAAWLAGALLLALAGDAGEVCAAPPPSAEAKPPARTAPADPFNQGLELFRQGKLEESLAALQRAAAEDPKDGQIQSWLGYLYLRLGRHAEAINHLSAAIEQGAGTVDTYNNLGNAHLGRGDVDGAIKVYRRAIELATGDEAADPQYNLGNALARKGLLPEALEAYQRAERLTPRDPLVQNNLGFVLEQLHAVEPAKYPLSQALARYREAVNLQPKNAVFQRNLGLAARRIPGMGSAALEALRRAVQLDPGDFASRVALAEMYAEGGQTDLAILHYQAAMKLDKKSHIPPHNLGLLLARQQKPDYSQALQLLRSALALQPDDAQVLMGLGWVSMQAGRLEESAAHYLKAIEKKADLQPAHVNLGIVMNRLKRPDRAIEHWTRALELDPADQTARSALAGAYRDAGKLDEAEKQYRALLERNQNDAGAWNNLGYVLERQMKTADALAAYRRAVEVDPRLAVAHNNLGAIYERQGNRESALQHYRRATELDPQFTDARRNLQRLQSRQ